MRLSKPICWGGCNIKERLKAIAPTLFLLMSISEQSYIFYGGHCPLTKFSVYYCWTETYMTYINNYMTHCYRL